jgi:hypothetical protein
VSKAELTRLGDQLFAQIEIPGALPHRRRSTALHDLRTYFIAITAYTDAAMHYNVSRKAPCFRFQALDAARQDSPGGPSPAGVKQRHALSRRYQVHRHTVGNGYGEQDSGCRRDPAIDTLYLNPAAPGIEAHELDAMYLVTERESVELR